MKLPGACPHIAALEKVVTAKVLECEDCMKIGAQWVHLRTCQTCGGTRRSMRGKRVTPSPRPRSPARAGSTATRTTPSSSSDGLRP